MRQSNLVGVILLAFGFPACKSASSTRAPRADSLGRATITAPASVSPATPSAESGAGDGGPRTPPRFASSPLEGAPSGGLFASCYENFRPEGVPHVDVLRLGLLCGPEHGLSLVGRLSGTIDEARPPVVYRWDADAGDCFRLFAVAAEPVSDIEVELLGPGWERPSLTNQNRPWVVVEEDRPFCARRGGPFEARLSTHAGRGNVSLSVFRGAHLLPLRRRLGSREVEARRAVTE